MFKLLNPWEWLALALPVGLLLWGSETPSYILAGLGFALGIVVLAYAKHRFKKHLNEMITQANAAILSYSESHPENFKAVRVHDPLLQNMLDGFNAVVAEAHGNRLLLAKVAESIITHAAKVAESAEHIVTQMDHQAGETAIVHDSLERLQGVFNITVETARRATRVAAETEAEGDKGKVVVTEAMGSVSEKGSRGITDVVIRIPTWSRRALPV